MTGVVEMGEAAPTDETARSLKLEVASLSIIHPISCSNQADKHAMAYVADLEIRNQAQGSARFRQSCR